MDNIVEYDENISMVHGAGLTIVLLTLAIPQKSKIRITYFANYLNLAGHWGAVTWGIFRNGVGVFPYDTIQDQLGLQSRPRKIAPIIFQGGDELQIRAVDDNTIVQPPVLETGIALRYELIG